MAFVTLSRLLPSVCISLLAVSQVLAQTVVPSNASTNHSVESLPSPTGNGVSYRPRILPVTDDAQGGIAQLEVRQSAH